jgi:hypothetical protein
MQVLKHPEVMPDPFGYLDVWVTERASHLSFLQLLALILPNEFA